jgi:hypothetical protein
MSFMICRPAPRSPKVFTVGDQPFSDGLLAYLSEVRSIEVRARFTALAHSKMSFHTDLDNEFAQKKKGLLRWKWASDRLKKSRQYSIPTTRPG